jgi:hypothetical protein
METRKTTNTNTNKERGLGTMEQKKITTCCYKCKRFDGCEQEIKCGLTTFNVFTGKIETNCALKQSTIDSCTKNNPCDKYKEKVQ